MQNLLSNDTKLDCILSNNLKDMYFQSFTMLFFLALSLKEVYCNSQYILFSPF